MGERFLSSVSQRSLFGPFFLLIYINDLPDGIWSICKIFSDDTFAFKMSRFQKIWTGIKRRSCHYQKAGLLIEDGL